ncbi:MAG: right-handed parallel beta-helix repeat-containing protein, partial [Candidatus Nanohaloarchaea archaeon]
MGWRRVLGVAVVLLGAAAVVVHAGTMEYYESHFEQRAYTVAGNTSLAEIAATHPGTVEREGDTCILTRPLVVERGGSLTVNGSGCATANMVNGAGILIRGSAFFDSVTVRSYNPLTGAPLRNSVFTYYQRRPFVETESRWEEGAEYVSAVNSTFAHLGYWRPFSLRTWEEESRWGFALYHLDGGRIINSTFHGNYYGFYTWNSSDILIRNSTSYGNIEYGFNFHDYSSNITIRGSTAYGNNNHGIIFSKHNWYNTIADNAVYNNTGRAFNKGQFREWDTTGIMLDQNTSYTTVVGNEVWGNREAVHIHRDSDHNMVRLNT